MLCWRLESIDPERLAGPQTSSSRTLKSRTLRFASSRVLAVGRCLSSRNDERSETTWVGSECAISALDAQIIPVLSALTRRPPRSASIFGDLTVWRRSARGRFVVLGKLFSVNIQYVFKNNSYNRILCGVGCHAFAQSRRVPKAGCAGLLRIKEIVET